MMVVKDGRFFSDMVKVVLMCGTAEWRGQEVRPILAKFGVVLEADEVLVVVPDPEDPETYLVW